MRRDQSKSGSDYRRWHNQTMWDRQSPSVYYREPAREAPEATADDHGLHTWENEGGACHG